MALLNHAKREINAKIVYYGPGLCGKTSNIKFIHTRLHPDSRGKLLSLATQTDRTLFFDFLPVELGEVRGFKTRFHLYTVPGQVFYNATRQLVLKGVDGIVFVADSQRDMLEANLESLRNLRENLEEMGRRLEEIPCVIQCNKRDLADVLSLEELDRALNLGRVPLFGASAVQGQGVFQTLTTVSKMVLHQLREMQPGQPAKAPEAVGREAGAAYRTMRKGDDRLAPEVPRPAASPATPPPVAIEAFGAPRPAGVGAALLPVRLRVSGQSRAMLLKVGFTLVNGVTRATIEAVEGGES
jgi:signal recognition particle receptor subunit beta